MDRVSMLVSLRYVSSVALTEGIKGIKLYAPWSKSIPAPNNITHGSIYHAGRWNTLFR